MSTACCICHLGCTPIQRGEHIAGNACNSSRIRGSNPSTRDTAGARSYLGGPSLANAAFTVFREQPISRAISEIDTASDRRNLRTSAQSSTIRTPSLPGSTPARATRTLVNLQLPHPCSVFTAVDNDTMIASYRCCVV